MKKLEREIYMTELKKRVLDALNELGGCGAKPGSYEKGWDDAIDAAWRAVKALADDTPEARWIPVAERLPEPFVRVIVCRDDGKVEQGWRDVRDWWKVFGTRTKQVTHWMPLPEPPKEDKNQ